MNAELDGKPVRFPSDKTRALLCFLVVEQGRVHRRSEPADGSQGSWQK